MNLAPKRYAEQVVGGAKCRKGRYSELDGSLSIDFNLFNTILVKDAYHSVYHFDKDFKDHLDETRSVRGFKGRVYASMLHWDMDDADSLEGARKDTLELISRLFDIGITEDNLRIYFSGNKGMHVFLLSNDVKSVSGQANTHEIVKFVCKDIAKGLKSFDESVYDRTRIIRCQNSLHGKSDRYKIPLTYNELLNTQSGDIYELAKHQRDIEWMDEYSDNEYIFQTIQEYVATENQDRRKPSIAGDSLIAGIANGFGGTGERNNYFTSYAGVLHSKGLSDGFILETLIGLNNNSSDPLPLRDLETIVDSVSKYKVSEEFSPIGDEDFKSMTDAYESWKRLKASRCDIDVGYELISKELYTFDPGKVMYVAARPGIGKTLLGMQMANNMANYLNEKALFFSLEMTDSAIFYRAAQVVSGTTERDQKTFSNYLYDDKDLVSETLKSWENMFIVDKSGLSIGKIEAYCNTFKAKFGTLGPIIIDYVGLMDGTDDYKGLSSVARELKNMAKRLGTRVIVLVQLSRKAGDGTVEVQLHHLVDSGALEASADIILGMWRSSGDQYRLHTKFVKNRDGIANVYSDLIQKGLNYSSVEYDNSMDIEDEEGYRKW